MNVPYLGLKEQHKEIRKELLCAVESVLDSSSFILGNDVSEFEKKFAKYCKIRYAVGVASGTDALFLSLKALNIGNNDEVITVPNSFLATASSIVFAGAKPVFVDAGEDMNIDTEKIEAAITEKTRAVIPVHLTGKPCEMKKIMAIAEKYNLAVIEDSAQAVGAEYEGKKVGSFGTGCFSLHPLKNLNACGDAGAITTDNPDIYEKIRQLRNIGLKNRNEADEWGINSRLDSIQAAILNVKLKYLEKWTEARRANASLYNEMLSELPVKLPVEGEKEKCVYHTYVIQTERRNEMAEFLAKNGTETKIHYPIPIHLQKAACNLGYKKGDFPVAEKQAETILSLPVHQYLTEEQIKYVCETIRRFFQ